MYKNDMYTCVDIRRIPARANRAKPYFGNYTDTDRVYIQVFTLITQIVHILYIHIFDTSIIEKVIGLLRQ